MLILGIVAACNSRSPEPAPLPAVETVVLPGNRAERSVGPRSEQLSSDEGVFEISPIRNASVGRAETTRIRIVPGAGFHINTEYPFVVQLEGAPGLKLEKLRFEGGKRGAVGDAEMLAEEELEIPIVVTPTTSGDHTLNGTIHFGICKATSCLQRSMPITLAVAAS